MHVGDRAGFSLLSFSVNELLFDLGRCLSCIELFGNVLGSLYILFEQAESYIHDIKK